MSAYAHNVRLIYHPPGAVSEGWDAYSARYAATSIGMWTGVHLEVHVEAKDMPTAKRIALRLARAGEFTAQVQRAMDPDAARKVVHVLPPR